MRAKVNDIITCICNFTHKDELTIGQNYKVLALHPSVRCVRIENDDGVLDWYCIDDFSVPFALKHVSAAPQVIRSEQIRPWDVDDTLILHGEKGHVDYATVDVLDTVENKTITFRIHEPMVRLLKEEHARGSYIIVWSRSGFAWAEAVIKALKLETKVHLIMSKPMVYFDDMPVETWLKDRVYLSPDQHYKK